ncbi:uncharacterized protein LOC103702207 [Phoenix dactylifera]|uniref:Uncharacterized protein LOC103702207 n=1 Tax=Phoenix dactylifera TaxID=42345 RepID=A0A8B9A7R9_PHODC|nr:uncharacterized protein LOC103702207 [Phoenix dactylifera]
MEFPFGHHHHHHHGRRDDEEEGQRYPPPGQRYPPPGQRPFDAPPPPPPYYDRPGGEGYGRPAYPPPPTHHVSHEVGHGYPGAGYGEGGYSGLQNRPPYSSGVHHVGHESWGGGAAPAPRQATVRIFTKAEENYSLSIRDGQVVLAPANPRDDYQHWIKDMRYATKVKDEEGFPSFALVNKVTGEAIKHSIGATHQVRLIRYNPDYLDESVLWTESGDTGEGFRCIRMVNNIGLNFDAFHGDEDHGGVHDGTTVVLWEWLKGKNQRWKIVPYSTFLKLILFYLVNAGESVMEMPSVDVHVHLCYKRPLLLTDDARQKGLHPPNHNSGHYLIQGCTQTNGSEVAGLRRLLTLRNERDEGTETLTLHSSTMEFPFGHHHHHHHGRRDDEEEGQRYPPPGNRPFDAPPPPPPYYDRPGGDGYGRPAYPPPPIHHVSHEVGHGYPGAGYGEGGYSGLHNRPPYSSGVHHVGHESGAASPPRQTTVRIFTKAEENYSLSIRDGEVVLAPANPRDDYQHWIKDIRYATKVKDEEGFPSFALVNKVTGEAIKHSIGATHQVRLIRYNPHYLDESVLWTESRDTGEGFRCIRMVNNIRLNFDAFHGDEDHGGVHDGTTVVLWEWLKGKNQRWKVVPYCEFGCPAYPPPPTHHVSHEVGHGYPGAGYGEGGSSGLYNHPPYSSGVESWGGGAAPPPRQTTVRIFTMAEENYSLSIRDGQVVLARANPRDDYQHWIKDMRFAAKVRDEEGFPSFALVNKATGEAIKHSIGATHQVRLIRYNPDYLDESVLWTESRDTGKGFRCIRMVNNIGLNFDAFHGDEDHGGVHDGTTVVLWKWLKGKNQKWKIVPY